MLIYNFQKEFIGIDEKDLQILGYKDLAQLRAEVADFADLFVKTPGYIYNFQHVHWLDFITCAESNEESKVVINTNGKSFKAFITVSTAYLIDNPAQKAYLVYLSNLRALTSQEYENISSDITQRPPLESTPKQTPITSHAQEKIPKAVEEYDTPIDIKEEVEHAKLESMPQSIQKLKPALKIEPEPEIKSEPTQKVTATQKSSYSFDPNIASKELGLPLDLIEEFLQDFIDQANDFKTDIYTALNEGDINNVKILSHKLKGVAANLRIEDAHEVLSVINAATDTDIIKTNLDDFYHIIAKLSGEHTAPPLEEAAPEEEHVLSIKDEDVPEKIDIPELSDDEFLTPEPQEDTQEDKKLEIYLDDEFENVKPEPEIKTENNIESNDVYSKEEIANEIGLDHASFNELFKDFVEEAHSIFTKINDALAIDDYETSKRQALKLKGMSDNMRMNAFTNELETLIHSTDKEKITEAVKRIDNILTTLKQED